MIIALRTETPLSAGLLEAFHRTAAGGQPETRTLFRPLATPQLNLRLLALGGLVFAVGVVSMSFLLSGSGDVIEPDDGVVAIGSGGPFAVAAGRANMTEDEVREVATGMIFTGAQAVDLKLVDEVGGLYEAKAKARQLGGLPPDAPVEELQRNPFVLANSASSSRSRSIPSSTVPSGARGWTLRVSR